MPLQGASKAPRPGRAGCTLLECDRAILAPLCLAKDFFCVRVSFFPPPHLGSVEEGVADVKDTEHEHACGERAVHVGTSDSTNAIPAKYPRSTIAVPLRACIGTGPEQSAGTLRGAALNWRDGGILTRICLSPSRPAPVPVQAPGQRASRPPPSLPFFFAPSAHPPRPHPLAHPPMPIPWSCWLLDLKILVM